MKWETLYCPNRSCHHYGRPFGQGLLVKNGTSHGKKQALCRSCGRRVSLTYGTAYFDLEADPALFELTVRALAEGNSIQGTARIVQIDKDTVCAWLNRAAHPCRRVMLSHWRDLPVTECQLDEWWSFVHTKEQNLTAARQVVKRREKGRVVEVTRKIVWGSADEIQARLAVSPTSTTINTSFVERDNLAWREHNRRLTRKTTAFSKELPWMEKQLWLSLAYYHFCLPHLSLREELPTPEPTRGHGSPRRWRPVTPAMAVGMTDHVWTTAELLGYRMSGDSVN